MSDREMKVELSALREQRWKCKECGCEFPHVEHDEGVERCSRCVEVEQQALMIDALREQVAALTAERDEARKWKNEYLGIYYSECQQSQEKRCKT